MVDSLDKNMDNKKYLQLAITQAKESVAQGGFPAGAIIVKNGTVVAKGVSIGNLLNDPTSHSETVSIRGACEKLQTTDLSGAILYASLKPCLMCFSVANWAGISKIIYGYEKTEDMVNKNYYEGVTDIEKVNEQNNRQIEIVHISDFKNKITELITEWEKVNL